jgi:hypothetical protein
MESGISVKIREHSPSHLQVKAACGVHDSDMLLKVCALVVTMVCAGRTTDIFDEYKLSLGI